MTDNSTAQPHIKQQLGIWGWLERHGLFVLCLVWLMIALIWSNRVIFGDEAMFGVAIIQSGLSPFEPLTQYDQSTTYGLHLLTVLTTSLIGFSNVSIRLPVLLIFFASMLVFSDFLKRQYRFGVAFIITFAMLFNPALLRYATEFKHYGLEVSFTILLLVTYVQYRQDNSLRNIRIYGITAILAIFFGLSTVLIVTCIFVLETLIILYGKVFQQTGAWLGRVISAIRSFLQTRWFMLAVIYYGVFLAVYITSIRTTTAYQTLNYIPSKPSLDEIMSLAYWRHAFDMLGWGMSGWVSPIFLVVMGCVALYLIISKNYKLLSVRLFCLVYLLVYMMNIGGLYPIWWGRHLLFIVPIIYLIFADLLNLSARRQRLIMVLSVLVVVGTIYNLVNVYRQIDICDFQLPADLGFIQPDDTVFVHLTGQPIYDWYKLTHDPDLPELSNPVIGRESGLFVPHQDLYRDFEANMGKAGAWSSVIHIAFTDNASIYDDYFIEQVMSVEKSKIFNYWTVPQAHRVQLEANCAVSVLSPWRAWVAEVICLSTESD